MPKKLSYDYVKEYIESFGYKLISKEYKNAITKLDMICDRNHEFKMSWMCFKSGQRCPKCYGSIKKTIDEIKEYTESFDYKLISKEYKNNKTKLKMQCDKGHEFEINWNNFQTGNRCPYCWYKSSSSKSEQKIQEYIASIYNGVIINNDRNAILNPNTQYYLELDVYLPELNKAIEFNGIYWHSMENRIIKDRLKRKLCNKANITLLIINENEWMYDQDHCYDKIRNFINE